MSTTALGFLASPLTEAERKTLFNRYYPEFVKRQQMAAFDELRKRVNSGLDKYELMLSSNEISGLIQRSVDEILYEWKREFIFSKIGKVKNEDIAKGMEILVVCNRCEIGLSLSNELLALAAGESPKFPCSLVFNPEVYIDEHNAEYVCSEEYRNHPLAEINEELKIYIEYQIARSQIGRKENFDHSYFIESLLRMMGNQNDNQPRVEGADKEGN